MITLSSARETPAGQVFRVEPSAREKGRWCIVHWGTVVASFPCREAAVERAHVLAANAWRLRQRTSRVVVMGIDGRPASLRFYGDTMPTEPSQPDAMAIDRAG